MATVNISKRSIFKRRRDGQANQANQGDGGSAVARSATSSSGSEFNPVILQDYAKKVGGNLFKGDQNFEDNINVAKKLTVATLAIGGNDFDPNNIARTNIDNQMVGQTINGHLVVKGDITQSGQAYITHAQHVEVENNLMQLNKGETAAQITGVIPGTTIAFSGIEINRGSADPYYMGVVEGAHPLIKIGKKNNMVTLAAREDAPMNNGVMLWDAANHRLKAVAAAPDSDRLGNVAAANYARTDIEEVFNHRVKFAGNIENDGFTEGLLTGSGYRLTPNGVIQADSLELRKSLTVPELIISKERSINGGLVTSVANGEVKSVNGDAVTLKGEHNSFIVGDRVRLQNWDAGLRYMEAEVTAVNGLTITLDNYNTTTRPKDGDSLVQWGHKTDTTRQSFLYQTSRGGGFFAVYNGVNSASLANKEVVRMGNLSNSNVGLTSEYDGKRFFELSNNRKEIAGCNFDETHLWTTGWEMHHNGNFSLGKGQINYNVVTNKVSFGEDVTLNWGQIEGAQAAIDAIEIGGRNLASNVNWKTFSAVVIEEDNIISFNAASLHTNVGMDGNLFPDVEFNVNTSYTISLYAKNNAPNRNGIAIDVIYTDGTKLRAVNDYYGNGSYRRLAFTTDKNKTVSRFSTSYWSNGIQWVKNFKLEKGNKATDWSPAPEDVDASIATAQAAATSVANTAHALAGSKTVDWATQITKDTVTAEFIRTRNLVVGDHIQMGPNAVISWNNVTGTSGIESTTGAQSKATAALNSAKVDATNKVDAIEIGGRNLASNVNWKTFSAVVIEEDNIISFNAASLHTNVGMDGNLFPDVEFNVNTSYTISLYAKNNAPNRNGIAIDVIYTDGTKLRAVNDYYGNGSYRRLAFTTDKNKTVSRFSTSYWSNGIQWVKNFKLEKGNKATDWSPAPEDVDANISAAQNTASTAVSNASTAQSAANTANALAATKVTADQATTITRSTVTAAYVNAFALNASSITTGTLSADRIAANSIDASKINFDNATGNNVNLSGTITSSNGSIGGFDLSPTGFKAAIVDHAPSRLILDNKGNITLGSYAPSYETPEYSATLNFRELHKKTESIPDRTLFTMRNKYGYDDGDDYRVEQFLLEAKGNTRLKIANTSSSSLYNSIELEAHNLYLNGITKLKGGFVHSVKQFDISASYGNYSTSVSCSDYSAVMCLHRHNGQNIILNLTNAVLGQQMVIANQNDNGGTEVVINNCVNGAFYLNGGWSAIFVYCGSQFLSPQITGNRWMCVGKFDNNW